MVQMWYMDPSPCGDWRLPHHCFPPKRLTLNVLIKNTGVYFCKVDLNNTGVLMQRISTLKRERSLSSDESFVIQKTDDNLKGKLDALSAAKELEGDEAHLVLDGNGYFDLQEDSGKWIRVLVEQGDLLVLPAGRKCRFSPTTQNFIRTRRLSQDKQPAPVAATNGSHNSTINGSIEEEVFG